MKVRSSASKAIWTAFLTLSFAMIPFRQAHAYLDPGTGSYIIQIAIASLLGLLLSVRMFWGRIVGFFKKTKAPAEEGDSPQAAPDTEQRT